MKKIKNFNQLLTGIGIGLIAGLLIAKLFLSNNLNKSNNTAPAQTQQKQSDPNKSNTKENNAGSDAGSNQANTVIPAKVFEVLKYIKTNGRAMQQYVGGRAFSNREKILPEQTQNGSPVRYQEWDVNPKIQGQNRGAERICTGSDGRSWYTNDHYKSFTEIK